MAALAERSFVNPGDGGVAAACALLCGIIAPLGLSILRTACADAKAWMEATDVHSDFRMAVNVSMRQLERPEIVDEILDVIHQVGLDAKFLELEVTESLMMTDGAQIVERLQRLRDCGLRISIDDFGTGYSSLSYLKRLPFDTVKIDISFISGIIDDPSDVAVVQAVVAFAKCIGFTVVAEGVETASQAKRLQEMNCDRAQGFYFARPLTAHEALRTIMRPAVRRAA
jgi:EAL domain-containing protein (putative c-di-GMP-specific phosphodiesterase class I)